jgi:hypothetical protein
MVSRDLGARSARPGAPGLTPPKPTTEGLPAIFGDLRSAPRAGSGDPRTAGGRRRVRGQETRAQQGVGAACGVRRPAHNSETRAQQGRRPAHNRGGDPRTTGEETSAQFAYTRARHVKASATNE